MAYSVNYCCHYHIILYLLILFPAYLYAEIFVIALRICFFSSLYNLHYLSLFIYFIKKYYVFI